MRSRCLTYLALTPSATGASSPSEPFLLGSQPLLDDAGLSVVYTTRAIATADARSLLA
jgi:hypothetical protein